MYSKVESSLLQNKKQSNKDNTKLRRRNTKSLQQKLSRVSICKMVFGCIIKWVIVRIFNTDLSCRSIKASLKVENSNKYNEDESDDINNMSNFSDDMED